MHYLTWYILQVALHNFPVLLDDIFRSLPLEGGYEPVTQRHLLFLACLFEHLIDPSDCPLCGILSWRYRHQSPFKVNFTLTETHRPTSLGHEAAL